jgi:phenylalanyl-tRNA synthetase beta chain
LPSDSSYRFERGVDPGMILPASLRATNLISELAAGQPSPEIGIAGKIPLPPADVSLRYERCARSIGVPISPQRIDQILERFHLAKTQTGEDRSSWHIPSFRADLQREVDLIEEVVRVFGIDQIPVKNESRFTPASGADRAYDLESAVRKRLIALGLFEARTSALISRSSNPFEKGALELRNPLSEDHVALRPTLLAGLLSVIERNVRGGSSSIRLFELGNVFTENSEKRHLAIALCGMTEANPHWRRAKRQLDFFDLKGAIEAIGIKNLSVRRSERAGLTLSADVFSGPNHIGFLGQLAASQAETTGATVPIFLAEIEIQAELLTLAQTVQFREIEKFPAISRDIAMIAPDQLSHAEVLNCLESAKEPLLAKIELFDLFSGKEAVGMNAGKKSLAYTLTYRDKFRTLTSDEINQVHAEVRERLRRELGVELRE